MANQNRIINLTFSPQNNDLGLAFKQKSILITGEYGNYPLCKTRIYKIGAGYSLDLNNDCYFNTILSYNHYQKNEISSFSFKPVSLEIGFLMKFTPIKQSYISTMYDHLLHHFKFGFGFKI